MKRLLNKLVCLVCVFALLSVTFAFAACGDTAVEVKAVETATEINASEITTYDYTKLFTVKKDGAAVTVTKDMIDSSAVKAEAGKYKVKCSYEGKTAEKEVTVKAESGGNQGGNTGGNQGGNTEADAAFWQPANFAKAKATIKAHTEGKTATYIFQAECTDLRGKSGPGYSGAATTPSDMAGGNGTESYVTYLYSQGISINFLVVSDRDVENAELSFRLGGEFMKVPVTPDVFTVRVDRKVSNDDLNEAEGAEGGALGAWDAGFMNYYTNPADTDRVVISSFECPASSMIEASELTGPGKFELFKITSRLSLKKGVNCISVIIAGAAFVDSGNHGTMTCIAPVIDYMQIKTTAQLGFYGQRDNGYGTNGLSFTEV